MGSPESHSTKNTFVEFLKLIALIITIIVGGFTINKFYNEKFHGDLDEKSIPIEKNDEISKVDIPSTPKEPNDNDLNEVDKEEPSEAENIPDGSKTEKDKLTTPIENESVIEKIALPDSFIWQRKLRASGIEVWFSDPLTKQQYSSISDESKSISFKLPISLDGSSVNVYYSKKEGESDWRSCKVGGPLNFIK
jgi:hypothetical protein